MTSQIEREDGFHSWKDLTGGRWIHCYTCCYDTSVGNLVQLLHYHHHGRSPREMECLLLRLFPDLAVEVEQAFVDLAARRLLEAAGHSEPGDDDD